MYYLIEWHRGTPTVPPVGAVNVPAENPKIQKIHIFEDFWEHFFLINHIGFSLKYVIPKSSTDFFSSKTKSFSNFLHFLCFYHISSPISESFIAQLLLHRTLDKMHYFFPQNFANRLVWGTNFLRLHFSCFLPSSAAQLRKFSFLSVSTAIYLWNSLDVDEKMLDDQRIITSNSAKIVKNMC